MSPIWASTSQFYSIEDIDHNAKSSITQSDGIETETTNKNLSKMRSYLKRCENAISSINLSGKRSTSTSATTSSENQKASKQSTSSWYIDELGSEVDESHHEFNYIDGDSKVTEIMEPIIYTIPEIQSTNVNNDSANDRNRNFQHQAILLHVSSSSYKNHCCRTSK